MNTNITTIIFDLGGVLIDWNPRYVYRKILILRKRLIGSLKTYTPMNGMKIRMPADH
jgi:FMN phosphatase YigB (HAD superfamily)